MFDRVLNTPLIIFLFLCLKVLETGRIYNQSHNLKLDFIKVYIGEIGALTIF